MSQDFWDHMLTKYTNMSDEEFAKIVDQIESSQSEGEENMGEKKLLIETDNTCCLLPKRNKIHVFGNQRPESNEKTFQLFSDIQQWLDDQKEGDCFILLDGYWTGHPYPGYAVNKTEYRRLENGFWCINNESDDTEEDYEYDRFNIITEVMIAIIRGHEVTIQQNDVVYDFHDRVKDLAKYCLWNGIYHHYKSLEVHQ